MYEAVFGDKNFKMMLLCESVVQKKTNLYNLESTRAQLLIPQVQFGRKRGQMAALKTETSSSLRRLKVPE
jgi:hypothetical protein